MLVIAAMMIGLTIFGGTKTIPLRVELDSSAEVVEHVDGVIEVTIDSQTMSYNGDQWRYQETRSGKRTLFGPETTQNKFLNKENLLLVLTNASFIAVMAVGMTGVIILAGIDLSVGSIYGLSALVGAMVLEVLSQSDSAWMSSGIVAVPLAVLVCCGVGAACGLANGAMTVGFNVHPFVITLGMMAGLRGLMIVLTNAESIGGFPESFTRGFFKLEVLSGIHPVPTAIMVVVALAGMFVLSLTVFGRRVFAIGGNETAARYAGVPVGRVKIVVYTLMGALAGLSGCIYLGYYGAGEPNAGMGFELKVIAATVIGGASLMGGRGTALGAVLGAIVIMLIDNGMVTLGIPQNWNQIVMGAAIIVAVVVDQSKSRFGARGR